MNAGPIESKLRRVWFVGIDPGKNGGIARVSGFTREMIAIKMPSTPRDVMESLRTIAEEVAMVRIEKVWAHPGQSAVAMSTFLRQYGILLGILVTLDMKHEETVPQKWQKQMSCMSKGDKNVTKTRAQALWPTDKVTHAIADAMLIAESCRLSHGTNLVMAGY